VGCGVEVPQAVSSKKKRKKRAKSRFIAKRRLLEVV
jgi:hypothetical protein